LKYRKVKLEESNVLFLMNVTTVINFLVLNRKSAKVPNLGGGHITSAASPLVASSFYP
jgi:hypothetical protein